MSAIEIAQQPLAEQCTDFYCKQLSENIADSAAPAIFIQSLSPLGASSRQNCCSCVSLSCNYKFQLAEAALLCAVDDDFPATIQGAFCSSRLDELTIEVPQRKEGQSMLCRNFRCAETAH